MSIHQLRRSHRHGSAVLGFLLFQRQLKPFQHLWNFFILRVQHLFIFKTNLEKVVPCTDFQPAVLFRLLVQPLPRFHTAAVVMIVPTQEKIDADRQAVKRLFNLIFDVVEKLEASSQVLITDHPDFGDDVRFRAALRERWRDGLKLVPEDWPRSV